MVINKGSVRGSRYVTACETCNYFVMKVNQQYYFDRLNFVKGIKIRKIEPIKIKNYQIPFDY